MGPDKYLEAEACLMRTHAHALNTNAARGEAADSKVSVLDPMAREARECFQRQAAAVAQLSARIEDGSFGRAVQLLYGVEGHVIVTGIGKSGLVGKKLASTLASTGTPSFFLHAAEAYHGDLGMVTKHDAVILISYSGETEEVARLLPHLQSRGVPMIGLVGKQDSSLGRGVDVALDVSVERELCPNNLAPTNSTLATLAMGDALSVALMRMRGFHAEDFAHLHPGGSLGRRLLGRVRDAMQRGPLPVVSPDGRAADCVFALARGRLPIALVMDGNEPIGIVSEAELRPALEGDSCLETPVADIMNPDVPLIDENAPLQQAEARLENDGLEALVVVCSEGLVTGVLTADAGT